MRALVFDGPGELSVTDRPQPTPGANEVVIGVAYAGICGSDIHGYTGETGRRYAGTVMGHEASGHVVEVGDNVNTDLVGEPVAFNPVIACDGSCGHTSENRCRELQLVGVHLGFDGAFAERVVVPLDRVHRTAGVSLKLAAMVEPLAVGTHASQLVNDREGPLLVIGSGMIGLSVAHMASLFGVEEIVVSDVMEARRVIASGAGFTALDPNDVKDAAFHRVIDAVSISKTMSAAMAATASGATIVVVGLGAPEVSVSIQALVGGERTLRGSFAYTNEDFSNTFDVLRTSNFDADSFPFTTIALEDAPAAFADLASGDRSDTKVLIELGGTNLTS